jgi:hypothetical protein
MWRRGIPALDIWVRAVRRKLWVETPNKPTRAQAALRILLAINRVKVSDRSHPWKHCAGVGLYSAKEGHFTFFIVIDEVLNSS